MRKFQGVKCPKCGKKGLNYADHPHAFGWKDYDRVACRYCGSRFKLSAPNTACTPTDGTHPANEPIQAENNPVISGESTPTIGG